jgi:hypothetical protein
VPRKKLPPDILEFFRNQGSKGGKKAAAAMTPEARVARAKKASASMTPEERVARAKKASTAALAARKAKKKALEK